MRLHKREVAARNRTCNVQCRRMEFSDGQYINLTFR